MGLFIGHSSSGKSAAAATFPTPHFSDFDGRIRGVYNCRNFINISDISYDQFLPPNKGWHDVETFHEDLAKQIGLRMGPKTEVIDSITSMLRLFIHESMNLQSGREIGNRDSTKAKRLALRVESMQDFLYEASAFYQVLDYFRGLPINVIFTAHVIDRYGKPLIKDELGNTKEDPYAESEIVGEKLSVRDKIQANLKAYFDEVYRFDKREVKDKKGNLELRHIVCFKSDQARSSLGLTGTHDITNKNFYEFWKAEVEKCNQIIPPKE